jgi:hypothetical protein
MSSREPSCRIASTREGLETAPDIEGLKGFEINLQSVDLISQALINKLRHVEVIVPFEPMPAYITLLGATAHVFAHAKHTTERTDEGWKHIWTW